MIHDTILRRGDLALRPLSVEDAPRLRAIVDTESWAGMSSPLPASDAEMAAQFESIIADAHNLAFAVELRDRFVGRTTFYDLVPGLKAEIGNTIYARDVWGTTVNPAAKLLLFGHAFDLLGLERVALRCDHRNTRSHGAILRLGASFEGTLRRFRPAADGTIADIDYFSVLREEWPDVRARLEERLAA
ncbi:GNAT family N-acetyltransferase [Planctomonas sp. JC2975]|uniref:GNAT family N-acetyltransferase n=1 Tax=Planctomonas sp. JC2975 TaxID=2729626 RepID=UPI00147528B1|nr:GNAT family protein [Planctomonas sp. JC2975]NNC10494.1 GNAT family N-acetyltransferase [Planctomonas sp. JC2975]